MSRAFTAASNQYLQNANAVLTAVPLTISLWFYPTTSAVSCEVFSITDNSAANNDAIRFEINFTVPNWTVALRHLGGEVGNPITTTMPTQNTWNNLVGTYTSGKVGKIYKNATLLQTGTSTETPTGLAVTNIGAYVSNSGANIVNPTTGKIADVGVWNIDLTQTEVTALSQGARPYTIRAGNLVAWWPLDGLQSPEPDLSLLKHNMSLVNGPTADFGPPLAPFTPRWTQFAPSTTTRPYPPFQLRAA